MNREYPDWNVFKAKAQGASREQFENLCRILFCEELGIEKGTLEAVKNQAGNETDLFYCRDKNIGFQSKFFDYKLNLQKFKDSIAKAKKYNPTQDTIYLYSNVELASDTEKEKLKVCVAEHGMACKLRFGKQILDKVSNLNNKPIYETFFCLNSEIESILKYGIERTLSYLEDIQTIIPFKDFSVVVDRQEEMSNLRKVLSNNGIVLIVGPGGCGKSSLTKMYIETLEKDGVGVRIYRGERFNEGSINEMLVCKHELFFEAYDKYDEKYFIIDSAEQIVLRKHPDELSLLIRMLRDHHWHLILTCRIEATGMLLDFLHDKTEQTVEAIEINRLTDRQLGKLSYQYGFMLPTDHQLRDFIRVPMELREYLKQDNERSQLSFIDFKKKEWKERICGTEGELDTKSKERESLVLKLAKALYVDNEKPFLSKLQAKEEVIKELRDDHVLVYNDNEKVCRFSHDLYGEWAVSELLDRSYKDNASIERLYKEYGKTVTGCRCLRQWISDKIGKDADIDKVVCELLKSKQDGRLEGELITAVLQSEEVNSFVTNNRELLLDDNFRILKRMLFWLPVSCVYVSRDEFLGNTSASVDLNGKGWETVIDTIYHLGKEYWVELYYHILPVILMWSKARAEGSATKQCGEIALELLQSIFDTPFKRPYYRLIPVIFRAVGEIGTDLEKYIRKILLNKHIAGDSQEWYVLEYVIKETDIGNYHFTRHNPQLMTEIWDYCWHGDHIDVERYGSFGDYHSFGLDRSFSIYVTDSRFQTSLAYMLMANQQFVMDFLLEFINKAVACYIEKTPQIQYDEIDVKLQGVTVKQWGNEELWSAYRKGIMSNVPDLIVSLLSDLQWYLDYVVDRGTADCDILRSLILKSKNVMITAVVTAVALKHLDNCRELIDELAKSERLTALDKHRWETEYDSLDVGMPKNANVRIGMYERDLQLKENAHKIQEISLANYDTGDIRRPVSFYDAIMSGDAMGPTRWIRQFFEEKKCSREEGQKMVREARRKLEKYKGISLEGQLSISSIDGIAPAYIQLCDIVDDDVRWCKDIVLHILNESHTLYNLAALYDGVAYCIYSIPQLLRLFPEDRSNILDSVLAVCLNDQNRINKPPIDGLVVEMIRIGGLWVSCRNEMEKMMGNFVSHSKIRSGRLRPVEISLALRMLPEKDLGFKFSLLKMELTKQLFRYGEKDVHDNYISPKQLSEPIAENLICNHPWWIRFYTEKLLMMSIKHNRVSEVHLIGLIQEMDLSGKVDRFFPLLARLARKVYRIKNGDYHIDRLKEILTFQDSTDIIDRMKGNLDFMKKSLQYMTLLVSRYDNDKNILKGLMMFAEYSGEEYLENWFYLIHRSLQKMEPRIISYAGLSELEDVMRKCQNVFKYGEVSSEGSAVRVKMIDVLDKMIDCGSSKAYVMKEYCE